MASTSTNINLTVLHLDLVKSSTYTPQIEKIGGADLTRSFINQIETLVQKAFESVPHPSEYDEFESLGGDGYRISFKDVNNAYQFVKYFCQSVEEEDNKEPNKKKRIFRVGAATGNVNFDSSKSGLRRIEGNDVLVTVSRLGTANPPGYFYIDKETFSRFSEDIQNKFQSTSVKGKDHEPEIEAYRCQMFINQHQKETQPKELNGQEKKQFREALLSAFPDLEDLKGILEDNDCGDWFKQIKTDESDENILRNLINKIESDGKTPTFLDIVFNKKSDNVKLKEFYSQYNN